MFDYCASEYDIMCHLSLNISKDFDLKEMQRGREEVGQRAERERETH